MINEAEDGAEKLTQIASELAKTHAEYEDKLQVGSRGFASLLILPSAIFSRPRRRFTP